MSFGEKLQQIDLEIASGELGKARDRLHGLIATYPNKLDLRRKLGDVYWQLQLPAMAGRYWYLFPDYSSIMEQAREAFEDSCGNDTLVMLNSLKFRGNLENLEDAYAREKLEKMRQLVQERYGVTVNFDRMKRSRFTPSKQSERTEKIVQWGCILLTICLACITVFGIVIFVVWLFT